MVHGTVEGIYITAEHDGPAQAVARVRAVAGHGLEGDRYYGAAPGPWVTDEGRDITLIEAEAIEGLAADTGIGLASGDARRQLVTRGIRLNDLVGAEFTVGPVRCLGRELSHPCRHLESLTADGVLRGLVDRGGLRAEILDGGEIAVGDAVAPAA